MLISDIQSLQLSNTSCSVDGIVARTGIIGTTEFANLPNHFTWSKESRYDNRIKRQSGAHLKYFSPTQLQVAIVVYPDNRVERLDGNSRAAAIREGVMANKPVQLFVMVYYVSSLDESKKLFMAFDNKNAVDRANDIVRYAYQELNMDIHSAVLLSGATTSIRHGYRLATGNPLPVHTPLSNAVQSLREGIECLDGIRIGERITITNSSKKSAGALGAYIAICQQNIFGQGIVREFLLDASTDALFEEWGCTYGGTATAQIAKNVYNHLVTVLRNRNLWNEEDSSVN